MVRVYTESDWEAVCYVHDRARPDELRGSCDPKAFIPLAEDPEAADVHTSEKLVACSNERIVGFAGVEGSYISYLYVDPDFYRCGVGRQLLHIAISMAGTDAWTIALSGNAAALSLYESEGFEEVRRWDGYNAGYPCTVVRLELKA